MNDDAPNPPKPLKKSGWFGKHVREIIKRNKKIEAGRELRRIDQDVLTVEGVAKYLHCSVPTVRNIPADDLPRYQGAGRRHLYLKEDVLRYVRGTVRDNPAADELVREIEAEELDSSADSGRRRSRKRSA